MSIAVRISPKISDDLSKGLPGTAGAGREIAERCEPEARQASRRWTRAQQQERTLCGADGKASSASYKLKTENTLRKKVPAFAKREPYKSHSSFRGSTSHTKSGPGKGNDHGNSKELAFLSRADFYNDFLKSLYAER